MVVWILLINAILCALFFFFGVFCGWSLSSDIDVSPLKRGVIKNHIAAGQKGAELLRNKFGLINIETRSERYPESQSISPQKALDLLNVSCVWISKPSLNVVIETSTGNYRVRFSEFDRYFLCGDK
jgi:hypothetical protein